MVEWDITVTAYSSNSPNLPCISHVLDLQDIPDDLKNNINLDKIKHINILHGVVM